ncbi:hypothetical protein C463_02111 [Halorubrum californiense DSM 19288]|uniref:Intracellular proteinase inhibitor BsuPI domain-containing protein n=1 Tax=Halorubrum californiense DSM 19288 TaxID=1227465 RepID=M0ELL3_9EURY|nr:MULTISPECIES: hypothetical protein [Halorubrum]ELZ47772.1 hypothetical protein C463_02111 [Halorubrum californiense DSM 19288]TKX71193.1 hypothetical protein EXE40_08135 [Halorubrum sp. GN11GM_10-3_MGM]
MIATRRSYLRGMGGAGGLLALAGCTSTDPDESGGDDSDGDDGLPGGDDGDTDAGGTRPEGTGGPGVSVVATDGVPDFPVRPAVEVVREAATSEHPPRLRTTLTNESNEQVRIGEGRAVHFEYVGNGSGALTLLPGDGEYPAEPGCWRLTDDIAITEEYRTFALDPGASSERLVDLYATPGEEACLPVGEYRFETTISVVSADAEPESSTEWGFAVVLE